MAKVINLIIPAAGRGSRFSAAGWLAPKPFILFNGKTMIEHVVENINMPNANIICIFNRNHNEYLDQRLSDEFTKIIDVEELEYVTDGTAITVMSQYKKINNDRPLIIANSDQLIDMDFVNFVTRAQESDLDGSIVVFEANDNDPKWSYARLGSNGLVTQVAEKNVISNLATVGIYYFKRGSDFVSACIEMIVANDRTNGEFYTCPVYNYMIKKNKRIGVERISSEAMNGLGTPEDLVSYLKANGFNRSFDEPE